ncbi:MAG: hypothetical protein IJU50_09985 [Lachnospiraceae bacterium]|nr:hypothetical protein [Lachnospiraceae bacterium]
MRKAKVPGKQGLVTLRPGMASEAQKPVSPQKARGILAERASEPEPAGTKEPPVPRQKEKELPHLEKTEAGENPLLGKAGAWAEGSLGFSALRQGSSSQA